MRRTIIAAVLLGSIATAGAEVPRTVTTHYYEQTLTVDALSIGLFLGGMKAEGDDGRDTGTSDFLMSSGLLGATFASPIIHGIHGHSDRVIESLLLRGSLATVGMVVGVETAECGENEILCGFDRIGPGVVAGLAVASVVDAVFLTEEEHDEPAAGTWVPQLGAGPQGVQVGVAAIF